MRHQVMHIAEKANYWRERQRGAPAKAPLTQHCGNPKTAKDCSRKMKILSATKQCTMEVGKLLTR